MNPFQCLVGTVLLLHSALNRLLGYDLKYPTGFKGTHLGPIGQSTALVDQLA